MIAVSQGCDYGCSLGVQKRPFDFPFSGNHGVFQKRVEPNALNYEATVRSTSVVLIRA